MKKTSIIVSFLLLIACTSSVDKKFVGQWVVYSLADKNYDGSLSGITCPLKKLEGTQETYSFALPFGNGREIQFVKKDNNTLIGVIGDVFTLKFNEETGRLIFTGGKQDNKDYMEIEFTKLK